jgi:hypothetical protein
MARHPTGRCGRDFSGASVISRKIPAYCDFSTFVSDGATALGLDAAGGVLVASEDFYSSLYWLGRLQGDGATDASFGDRANEMSACHDVGGTMRFSQPAATTTDFVA